MTSAIARWHSSARPPSDALEQAYADQLEAEMQEMAIQLHKVDHSRSEAMGLCGFVVTRTLIFAIFSVVRR